MQLFSDHHRYKKIGLAVLMLLGLITWGIITSPKTEVTFSEIKSNPTGYLSQEIPFAEKERRAIFATLPLGNFIHLGPDLLQKHYVPSYYWFFPFSYQSFELGLFWSGAPPGWLVSFL